MEAGRDVSWTYKVAELILQQIATEENSVQKSG